jgi:hypothetical protein
MPRKPKGDKPMTGAERAKAHRAKKAKPKTELRKVGTAQALQTAWEDSDLQTRETLLLSLGLPPFYASPRPDPMDTPIVPPPRAKPRESWRNMAAPGSLLKGAK